MALDPDHRHNIRRCLIDWRCLLELTYQRGRHLGWVSNVTPPAFISTEEGVNPTTIIITPWITNGRDLVMTQGAVTKIIKKIKMKTKHCAGYCNHKLHKIRPSTPWGVYVYYVYGRLRCLSLSCLRYGEVYADKFRPHCWQNATYVPGYFRQKNNTQSWLWMSPTHFLQTNQKNDVSGKWTYIFKT